MHGILGSRQTIEKVTELLADGYGEKLRDEWESGMTLQDIAEKYNLSELIVKKVISWDQVAKDCKELGLL